jgi:hypothetical protein
MSFYNPYHHRRLGLKVSDYIEDDYEHYGLRHAFDISNALKPLIDQIIQYDTLRQELDLNGGWMSDLVEITRVLNTSFTITTSFGRKEVQLSNQIDLLKAIRDINYDLHLDIRQLHTRLPVYYICRVHRDYWGEYSLIIEDFYMSPKYPMTDERFVKIMSSGHDVYFLRLSQFREGVAKIVGKDSEIRKVDTILYDIGRYIFQAAWHEDQRPRILAAKHLDLPHFRQAIELVYLCLSGELCELRNAVNKTMLRFFEDVYPHPPIRLFLEKLSALDGVTLNKLHEHARELYERISRAFSNFLSVKIPWSSRRMRIPLWKLLSANFSRLPLIEKSLKDNQQLTKAAMVLEEASQSIIEDVLNAAKM